jgi:hypothetical protein
LLALTAIEPPAMLGMDVPIWVCLYVYMFIPILIARFAIVGIGKKAFYNKSFHYHHYHHIKHQFHFSQVHGILEVSSLVISSIVLAIKIKWQGIRHRKNHIRTFLKVEFFHFPVDSLLLIQFTTNFE